MGGSSAHRRAAPNHRPLPRGGRRSAFRPVGGGTGAAAPAAAEATLSYAAHALTPDNPGFALLVRMGHTPGAPLGAAGGLTAPIPIVVRAGRAGLGGEVARSAPVGGLRGREGEGAEGGDGGDGGEALSFTRDPLRPRCRWNAGHVVRDIKALQSHEARCPDREAATEGGAGDGGSGSESEGGGEEDMMSEISEDEDDALAGCLRHGLALGGA